MTVRSPHVEEVEQLEQVEAIAARYRERNGLDPINVSHWDPSLEFGRQLAHQLVLPVERDPLPYIYSYTLDQRAPILRQLGFDPERHGCLITGSGTQAMLSAMNWLKASRRVTGLTALGPFYFPLVHQARTCDVPLERRFMARTPKGFRIPEEVFVPSPAGLWVTNPVYCTGASLDPHDRDRLREYLAAGGTVVLDECFAVPGRQIAPELADAGELVALYAPHKALCVNGIKFGLVVFDRRYQDFFDQWADVLCGPLNLTNAAAVHHFFSDNFSSYWQTFSAAIEAPADFVRRAVAATGVGELDNGVRGHFISVYYPNLSAQYAADDEFLSETAEATGAIFMAGTRNHFDPAFGLSFRINLALDNQAFRGAVVRLARHLAAATQTHPR